MRPLPLLVLTVVVSAAVAAGVAVLLGEPQRPDAAGDARIARLEAEIDALRGRPIERPAQRPVQRTARRPATDPATSPGDAAPRARRAGDRAESGATRPLPSDDTGRAFLARYVRSFDHDSEGSEFFRLAVEAFAPELVQEIATILVDPDRPRGARTQLAKILGTPALRGDATAIEAFIDALRTSPDEGLAAVVFAGLRVIGDRGAADRLEAVAPYLERPALRGSLYETLAALTPDGANAALLRLLAREEDESALQALVKSVNGADPAGALEVIRRAAASRSADVRTRAAEKLAALRTPASRAFLDEWIARETAPAPLGRLTAARAVWDAVPEYSAQRLVGPADVANPAADNVNAWCPQTKNGGREWILLTYAEPLVATHLRVYEVYTGGAVVGVEVEDEFGGWHVAWEGAEPERAAGTFEVRLRALDRPVKRVRVLLDTSLRDGWHEIDAVELVGPGGSAWAAEAATSSTYGDP